MSDTTSIQTQKRQRERQLARLAIARAALQQVEAKLARRQQRRPASQRHGRAPLPNA